MNLRILGIDPGVAIVGFGIIESEGNKQQLVRCGVITTPAHTQLSYRLHSIYTDLTDLIKAFRPDAIAVEELFFNTNLTTGISVAQARGVILLACYESGVPVYEYTPLQVKQAVVGYGRAEKNQVMDMVKRILRLQDIPRPDDAADAVAIALCHARSCTSLLYQKGVDNTCSTI